MATIDLDRVNRLVLYKQHLAEGPATGDVEQVARDIFGLHGTCPTTPYLSLFSRGAISSTESLDEAMYVQKSLIRARCMRGTIYILPLDLFSVAYSALKAPMIRMCTEYCRRRGVDDSDYAVISGQVLAALEDDGLTAVELKRKTGTGLNMSPILVLMCDQGLIVRGPPKGGWTSNKHTYHIFGRYFPGTNLPVLSEREATAQLITAYLKTFGPATETDIAWWAGLGKAAVRNGLADIGDQISHTDLSGVKGSYALLGSDEKALKATDGSHSDIVNLLPTLDGYIMGYKERTRYLDAGYYDYVFDRSGNATNTILLNGRIIGVWDRDSDSKPCFKFHLFEKANDHILREIRSQCGKLGVFINGRAVSVSECHTMQPLTERPPGAVMAPLRNR
jgi:hypothetical protein